MRRCVEVQIDGLDLIRINIIIIFSGRDYPRLGIFFKQTTSNFLIRKTHLLSGTGTKKWMAIERAQTDFDIEIGIIIIMQIPLWFLLLLHHC